MSWRITHSVLFPRYFRYPLYLVALSISSVLQANEEKLQVHIPASPLAEALIEFSLTYEHIIIGRSSILEGHTSAELKGEYTAEQALALLLKGTNLSFKPNKKNAFIVKAIEKPSPLPKNLDEEETMSAEEMVVLAPPTDMRSTSQSASDTSLDNDFISDNNITSLQSLSTQTPNINILPISLGFLNANIRGIANYGNTFQSTQVVPIHHNGQYLSATPSSGLILFDIENIDIYRGPQSALSGRSAVGGSFYIHSTPAKLSETEVYANVSVGNYNLKNIEAAINLPLGDDLAFRLAGFRETRDGYINSWGNYSRIANEENAPYNYSSTHANVENTRYNGEDYDNSDKTALRLSGLWQMSESTNLSAHWEEQKNHSLPSAASDPYIVENYERAASIDSPIQQTNDTTSSGLNLEHSFKDIKFSYLLRHAENQYSHILDYDNGYFLNEPRKYEFRRYGHDEKLLSHNVELQGNALDTQLQWLLGSYDERINRPRRLTISDYSGGDNGSIWALGFVFMYPETESRYRDTYGQIKYNITPKWNIELGARYLKNKRSFGDGTTLLCWATNILGPHPDNLNTQRPEANLENGNSGDFANFLQNTPNALDGLPCFNSPKDAHSGKENAFTYQISNLVDINDDLSAQLTYSTGYRPGDLISGTSRPAHKSKNLELGLIGLTPGGELSYEVSLFYNKHANIVLDVAERGFDARVYGLEFTLRDPDFVGGTLELSGAYLKTKIGQFDLESQGDFFVDNPWNPPSSDPELAAQNYVNVEGNSLPNSPEYTLSVSYEYDIKNSFGTWTPRIGIKAVGDYYLDLYNSDDYRFTEDGQDIYLNDFSRQKAYRTIDLSFSWLSPSNRYKADLSVFNATDENIKTWPRESFFSNEGFTSNYASPRVIKFTVSYRY